MNSPSYTCPASIQSTRQASTRLRSCAGRPCRCWRRCSPTPSPRKPSTVSGAFHSWSSGRTASWSTTPSVKAWRRTFGPPIPIAGDGTGSLPGDSSGMRCRGPAPPRCGATPRTCSTCSKIRMIRGVFFPTRSIDIRSMAAGPATGHLSKRSFARRRRPPRRRSLPSGGSATRLGFRIARDAAGSIAGLEVRGLDSLPRSLIELDPVARRWHQHLQTHPVPSGQKILFNRLDLTGPDEAGADLPSAKRGH